MARLLTGSAAPVDGHSDWLTSSCLSATAALSSAITSSTRTSSPLLRESIGDQMRHSLVARYGQTDGVSGSGVYLSTAGQNAPGPVLPE